MLLPAWLSSHAAINHLAWQHHHPPSISIPFPSQFTFTTPLLASALLLQFSLAINYLKKISLFFPHANIPFPLAASAAAAAAYSRYSASNMSLPIVFIAILGILTTAIFLLTYYVFVIKCCLNWHSSGLALHLFSTSRRHTLPSSTATESTGLDPAAIRSIPTFRYSSIPFSAAAECAVCLSDFRDGEHLRLLPNCAHAFHIDCIDAWLQSKTSCPLCRSHITDPFSPPADRLITPIQSVVIEVTEEGISSGGARKLFQRGHI